MLVGNCNVDRNGGTRAGGAKKPWCLLDTGTTLRYSYCVDYKLQGMVYSRYIAVELIKLHNELFTSVVNRVEVKKLLDIRTNPFLAHETQ